MIIILAIIKLKPKTKKKYFNSKFLLLDHLLNNFINEVFLHSAVRDGHGPYNFSYFPTLFFIMMQ
jgi:hypothetical protein